MKTVWTITDICTDEGVLVGRIWSNPEKGSFFVQVKSVPRGSCFNIGPNATHILLADKG